VLQVPALKGLNYEHFSDANLSGKGTVSRPGYNAMMSRLRTAAPGEIAGIACYDQSRLHRDTMNFLLFMAECEQRHVPVYDARGLVPQSEKLTWTIKAAVATDERERVSQKVKDNLAYLIMTGKLLGHAPAGYRRVNGVLELDPENAAIVLKVFDLYASGRFSIESLALHLNEISEPLPRNHDFPKQRAKWSRNLLKGMLANPSYLGRVAINGQLQPGTHPALVEEAVFKQCQSVRERNKRRRTSYRHHRNVYPLAPLLTCGRCGRPLHGRKRPELNNRHWYRCSNRAGGGCDLPYIPGAVLEDAVAYDLRRYVSGEGEDARLVERLRAGLAKAPERDAKQTLKALDAREGRVKFMWEQGHLDREDYMARIFRINTERQAARQQGDEQAKTDLRWATERIVGIVGLWQNASPADKGLMAAEVYESIDVDRTAFGIEVVATPNARWTPFFRRVMLVRSNVGARNKFLDSAIGVGGNLAAQPSSAA